MLLLNLLGGPVPLTDPRAFSAVAKARADDADPSDSSSGPEAGQELLVRVQVDGAESLAGEGDDVYAAEGDRAMSEPGTWHAANQRHLMAALAAVRAPWSGTPGQRRLMRRQARAPIRSRRSSWTRPPRPCRSPPALEVLAERVRPVAVRARRPPALRRRRARRRVRRRAAPRPRATPAGASRPSAWRSRRCPEPHWSALTPAAPLRRWRLVELGGAASRSPRARCASTSACCTTWPACEYLDERLRRPRRARRRRRGRWPPRSARSPTRDRARWSAAAAGRPPAGGPALRRRRGGAAERGRRRLRRAGPRAAPRPARGRPARRRRPSARRWSGSGSARRALAGARCCWMLSRSTAGDAARERASRRIVERGPRPLVVGVARAACRRGSARSLRLRRARPAAAEQRAPVARGPRAGRGGAARRPARRRGRAVRPRAPPAIRAAAAVQAQAAATTPDARSGTPAAPRRGRASTTWPSASSRPPAGTTWSCPSRSAQTAARRSPPRSASRARSTSDWGFAASGARGPGHQRAVRRRQRHRQDHGRRGARPRAAARPLPHRPQPRWSASTSARPRRTCAASSTPPRTAARSCSSTRPTRCSASAARSRTATTATPTSRSATCCSGWRPTAGLAILTTNLQERARPGLPAPAALRRRSSRSPTPRSAREIWRRVFPRATPDRRARRRRAGPAQRGRRQHPQHRAGRGLPGRRRRRARCAWPTSCAPPAASTPSSSGRSPKPRSGDGCE